MSKRPSHFRQRDLTAALRATKQAGVSVREVRVGKDGITLVTGKPADDSGDEAPPNDHNEWDGAT